MATAASADAIVVSAPGFEVSGNTLLPPEAIQARLAQYRDDSRSDASAPASLHRLKAAAAAVQELYRRAGYGGVVAFLPEQTVADGIARIRVVEGKLAHIDISGNEHFSSAAVLASLPGLSTGQTPRVREIDEQIQMANESPVRTVQVLLQPGSDPGTIDAKLTVAERPIRRFNLRLDNTGNASTGRWRSALGWMDGDFLGRDQVLGLDLQFAPEHPEPTGLVAQRQLHYSPALRTSSTSRSNSSPVMNLAPPTVTRCARRSMQIAPAPSWSLSSARAPLRRATARMRATSSRRPRA